MTYHVSKFCPLSGQFAPNLEQPNHWPVEKPSAFAVDDEAFLVIPGAREVSTHDQKVRTCFRPGNPNMVWEESTATLRVITS
jgi:hypothetical protein